MSMARDVREIEIEIETGERGEEEEEREKKIVYHTQDLAVMFDERKGWPLY
jgi:hypothetical protein